LERHEYQVDVAEDLHLVGVALQRVLVRVRARARGRGRGRGRTSSW
jgi:hypothetical protein